MVMKQNRRVCFYLGLIIGVVVDGILRLVSGDDYVVNTLNNPGAAKAILYDIEEAFKTRFAYVLSSEFPNDPQIYTRTCLQGVLHLTGLKCILP